MEKFHDLKEKMKPIYEIIDEINEEKYKVLFRFLNERIENPENFVVLLGETSSGKTTLLNGLLQDELLLTSARPTTGAVIELMDNKALDSYNFYAVNKDATLEPISESMFKKLSKEPDEDLERLRVEVPKFPHELQNLRLFDTPGYGSLHDEHERILKEFIPNSDIIVYVVSYRIGFKENDHHFMKFIAEVLDENTQFFLVVNRVPNGVTLHDNRIKEIQQHAQDCLHSKLNCYIVYAEKGEESDIKPQVLPKATTLWHDLKKELLSKKRMDALARAFHYYQKDLLLDLKSDQEQKLAFKKASKEEIDELNKNLEEFLAVEDIAKEKIKSTFVNLYPRLEKLMDHGMKNINKSIIGEIDKSNQWVSKDECVGFVQSHLLPIQIKQETKTITDYLQVELERLDEEIDSLLNTAVQKLETQIALKASIFKPFIFNFSNRMGQKMAGRVLTEYFKQFGGAGGAGAGVANAAKKGLKNIGKLFNKKFSRETHNALAKFLKKIGATSTKAISAAAAVIIESLFYLYDSLTWQKDLGEQVTKATAEWRKETLGKVLKDMEELKEYNYQSIEKFFNEYRESSMISQEECIDVKNTDELSNRIKRIDELLGTYDEDNIEEVCING